jgi:CheY-like chemotaxis protein
MASPRILIVEDERIIAAELALRIARLGYEVIATVGSGAEAIAQARENSPDLVLMDIGLPGEMDGLEAGIHIWESFKIPIVYATAYTDEVTMAQARTPQPVLSVRKPFDISQLRQTLAQALAAPP